MAEIQGTTQILYEITQTVKSQREKFHEVQYLYHCERGSQLPFGGLPVSRHIIVMEVFVFLVSRSGCMFSCVGRTRGLGLMWQSKNFRTCKFLIFPFCRNLRICAGVSYKSSTGCEEIVWKQDREPLYCINVAGC